MGYIRHHAIIVTLCYHDPKPLLDEIERIFGHRPDVVSAELNDYKTVFVGPDGSKEGWSDSHRGDERRAALLTWIRAQSYEDGSNPYSWVELQYGDERGEDRVLGSYAVEREARRRGREILAQDVGGPVIVAGDRAIHGIERRTAAPKVFPLRQVGGLQDRVLARIAGVESDADQRDKYNAILGLSEIAQARLRLDALTDEERLNLFRIYCRGCGSNDPSCTCTADPLDE